MTIVVQKFGGTSVATPEARNQVVQKISTLKEQGIAPVVVVSAIGREGAPYATDTLIQYVKAYAGEMAPREYDLLVSCGEIISAVVMATMLTQKGYKAVALTGGQSGIITNQKHMQADLVVGQPEKITAYIEEGIIPVVAGFQGLTTEGEITTLGRGGSDTSAAMLGSFLKAERIEIYTDVDGIMTADPRVYEKASIISEMSYTEVFQMADSGAKVIHPRAVEYAMRANIPLIIKNTFTEEEGTKIVQKATPQKANVAEKTITGIAHRLDRVQVYVSHKQDAPDDLLERMAEKDISIDLINLFPEYQVFTIDKKDKDTLDTLLQEGEFTYKYIEACCKITVIGERMTGVPGVMAKIASALKKAQVDVLQTADSLTTIACLIHESHLTQAVNVLHEVFDL